MKPDFGKGKKSIQALVSEGLCLVRAENTLQCRKKQDGKGRRAGDLIPTVGDPSVNECSNAEEIRK